MIERIRDGLWYLRLRFSCRNGRQRRRKGSSAPAVKGVMHPVIVVKPDNAMFDQAMFFLSDEYLRQHSAGPEEILRQARACVEEYTPHQPGLSCKRGGKYLWLLPVLLLGLICFLFVRFGIGIELFCPKG